MFRKLHTVAEVTGHYIRKGYIMFELLTKCGSMIMYKKANSIEMNKKKDI